ncbi:MAG: indolepyruvate ferredoxin oxidoreductase subunit alpha, partial [Clostridia bacterium]|nr:indolepyruvate ferredoxin oxidoreductase subunit alpha [Clostridia bacterium]
MGNAAIALGALSAGVGLVAGYPGTPSSEIIETVSKYPHVGVHVEWSVNEKAALEVAAAAAYSGVR